MYETMFPCITVPLGNGALPVQACDLVSGATIPEVGQCPSVAVTLWTIVLCVLVLCGDYPCPMCVVM